MMGFANRSLGMADFQVILLQTPRIPVDGNYFGSP